MANTSGSIDIADAIDVEVDTRAIAMELVCADGETAIRYIKSLNGVDTETFIGDDGAPLTPTVWTPGACVLFSPSVSQELICADDEPGIRQVTVSSDGDVTVEFIGADGATITPTLWFPGDCCACDGIITPVTMVSGIRKITGVTPLTPPADNYRSMTLTVQVNTVQVSFGGSDVAIIPAGISLSWGASGDSDLYLGTVPTFTGQNALSEYIVHWIAH